jgi:hypothetical protein
MSPAVLGPPSPIKAASLATASVKTSEKLRGKCSDGWSCPCSLLLLALQHKAPHTAGRRRHTQALQPAFKMQCRPLLGKTTRVTMHKTTYQYPWTAGRHTHNSKVYALPGILQLLQPLP